MSPRLSKATIAALLVAVALISVGGQQSYIPPAGGALTVPVSVPVPGIAVTSTDGVRLENATAATAGVPVQQSPRLRFRSHVWDTTPGADETNDWWIESVPVSGTTQTGLLKFVSSLNGGAATTALTVANNGVLTSTFSIVAASGNVSVASGGKFRSTANGANISFPADAQFNFQAFSDVAGFGLDVATDAVAKFRTRAQSAYAAIDTGNHLIAGVVAISATAPSAPVACTSPTVTNANGTAAFLIDVGTTCAGISTLSFTMPAATNGWTCNADSLTAPATSNPEQSATTTTSVTITNYVRTTGVAGAWADGADISISCIGR